MEFLTIYLISAVVVFCGFLIEAKSKGVVSGSDLLLYSALTLFPIINTVLALVIVVTSVFGILFKLLDIRVR